jgi:hypothetical protein
MSKTINNATKYKLRFTYNAGIQTEVNKDHLSLKFSAFYKYLKFDF